jgi:hypothetical protein
MHGFFIYRITIDGWYIMDRDAAEIPLSQNGGEQIAYNQACFRVYFGLNRFSDFSYRRLTCCKHGIQ